MPAAAASQPPAPAVAAAPQREGVSDEDSWLTQASQRITEFSRLLMTTPETLEAAPAASGAPAHEEPAEELTHSTISGSTEVAANRSADATTVQEEACPVCMEEQRELQQWPGGCRHAFCARCSDACLRRSLRCPMCRAEAPASAAPGPSRTEMLLSAALLIRVRELERLRDEAEAARPQQREPRTRVGRWVSRRVRAASASSRSRSSSRTRMSLSLIHI